MEFIGLVPGGEKGGGYGCPWCLAWLDGRRMLSTEVGTGRPRLGACIE